MSRRVRDSRMGPPVPPASSISYKPFGGMTDVTYGNNLKETITYNQRYEITSMVTGNILNLGYANYDDNGNSTAIKNNLDGTKNKSFGYDALNRLSSANGQWGSIGWIYDGVGNRTSQTDSAGTSYYSYQPGSNKLSSVSGAESKTMTNDANGNTYTENNRVYTYNQNQRLVRVVDGGVTKGEYTYNGYGQRVKKVANAVTTYYHYDLRGRLIAESNSTGTITAEYVYLNGQPLAKIEGTNTYYYHNDHLGTPQKLTDSTGTVQWSADYKPFGEAYNITGSITNNLRGRGQYFDAETGLLYNYYRDLNPAIGRYIEKERIGLRGGINLYVFVGNNPVNWIDPKGLSGSPWITFLHWGAHAYHVYDFIHLLYGNEGWTGEDDWARDNRIEEYSRNIDQLERDLQDDSRRLDELIRDLERRRQWERDNGLRSPCR